MYDCLSLLSRDAGAIILATGGDQSDSAEGSFYVSLSYVCLRRMIEGHCLSEFHRLQFCKRPMAKQHWVPILSALIC
jgi:hypothetical protein